MLFYTERLGKDSLRWCYLNKGWVCTKLNGVKSNKYNVLVNLGHRIPKRDCSSEFHMNSSSALGCTFFFFKLKKPHWLYSAIHVSDSIQSSRKKFQGAALNVYLEKTFERS